MKKISRFHLVFLVSAAWLLLFVCRRPLKRLFLGHSGSVVENSDDNIRAVQVNPDTQSREYFVLNTMAQNVPDLQGHSYFMSQRHRSEKLSQKEWDAFKSETTYENANSSGKFKSSKSEPTYNLYIFEDSSLEGQWLLPDNTRKIKEFWFVKDWQDIKLAQPQYGKLYERLARSKGVFLSVYSGDSNQDTKINDKDEKILYYYSIKDKRLHEVETQVARVYSTSQSLKNKVFMVYSKQQKTYMANYNTQENKVTEQKELQARP